MSFVATCSEAWVHQGKNYAVCRGDLSSEVLPVAFNWSQVDPSMLSMMFLGGCFMAVPAYAAAFGGKALMQALR